MLEYLSCKKWKKHHDEKNPDEQKEDAATKDEAKKEDAMEPAKADTTRPEAGSTSAAAGPSGSRRSSSSSNCGTPVLEESDQAFLERVLANSDEEAPPLPPRPKTPSILWGDSDSEANVPTPNTDAEGTDEAKGKVKGKGKDKDAAADKDNKKKNRFSFLQVNLLRRKSSSSKNLEPATAAVTEKEADRETADLSTVLAKLNLAAGKGNKAVSLSEETTELVNKFTLVFKDLMNGVPTAGRDLMALIEDHDGVLSRNYEKLPSSLKKLITTLPTKLTSTLAPELLAVAAEAQGMNAPAAGAGKDELKSEAMRFLTPSNLSKLVTQPGAIASMLKGIVNALRARWPAFMGTNVVWAVALSILMFVLWYCHKRGREERLEREKSESSMTQIKDEDRIEELPDDPALPAPKAATDTALADAGTAGEASKATAEPAAEPVGPSVKVTAPEK